MNTFDIVFIVLLFFFFFRGFLKGFFYTLIGPLCLVFWSIIGIILYDADNNIIASLSMVIFGTIIGTSVVLVTLALWKRQVHEQHRNYVFWGSRILGAVSNTAWNGTLTAALAVLLMLMPLNFLGMEKIQQQIQTSQSYVFFYSYLISPFPVVKNIQVAMSVIKDYRRLEQYRDTAEYKAVFSDPKIQYVVNNTEMMKKIQSKDAMAVIQSPQIQQILKDEHLMMRVAELGKKIYHDQSQLQLKP